jgi:hypothetical protein
MVAAMIAGLGEPAYIRVRPFVEGVGQADITLSRPELGGVVPGAGLEAASDRVDGQIVAWIQGGKLVAGYHDREPGTFVGLTRRNCCVPALPTLEWQAAFDVWGPMRYDVLIDGKSVGVATNVARITLAAPLRGARHRWQVVGSDARGQTKRSPTRTLIVDDLRPRQTVHYKRQGRRVTVRVRSRDVRRPGHRASGIKSIVVSWGDRSRSARGIGSLSAGHRYRRGGTYTLTITSRDVAGNANVRKRTVRIR